METKHEITKYLSFPILLIGSGLFFGVIGWWGLAHTAESILFFSGSLILSLTGSLATLYGLMSLEKPVHNNQKMRKLKSEISNDLKIQYPTYILKVEQLKQQHQTLTSKMPGIWEYCDVFRLNILKLNKRLDKMEGALQDHLKNDTSVTDDDTVDDIATKILWSERQIQLAQYRETLKSLSTSLTTSELERYRVELTQISAGLTQLDKGIGYYRDLMIHCNNEEADFSHINDVKQKVDKLDNLMSLQVERLRELGIQMNTICEMTESEISIFLTQLDEFAKASVHSETKSI